MSKFIERFKQVYRKPYPTAHYPENGSNGLLIYELHGLAVKNAITRRLDF